MIWDLGFLYLRCEILHLRRRIWDLECGIWNEGVGHVECGIWNGVVTWNVEYGMMMRNLEFGMCKEGFGNWNMECGILGFGMWNME